MAKFMYYGTTTLAVVSGFFAGISVGHFITSGRVVALLLTITFTMNSITLYLQSKRISEEL